VFFCVRDGKVKTRTTFVYLRNSIELAIGKDNCNSFIRIFDDTVLDRTKDVPYNIGAVDVLIEKDIWKMWYSQRKILNFRTKAKNSYRAGFAICSDRNSYNWKRQDDKVGIEVGKKNEWDEDSIEYLYVIEIDEKIEMFYSGGGFGRMGFGAAVVVSNSFLNNFKKN
jgi:hypothetical protein